MHGEPTTHSLSLIIQGKIRIDKHSSLTAAMDAQSKKEKLVMTVNSIRENLSLNTLQSSKKIEYIAPKRNSTLHT